MIKINYKKCCWRNGKCTSCACNGNQEISNVPKSKDFKHGGTCIGCVEACPVGALKRAKKVEFDKKKCISCGACVSACKHGAISLI